MCACTDARLKAQARADVIALQRRRPIAQKTGGIGVWDNVLEIMTVIAVVTNCALVGRTSAVVWRALPRVNDAVRVRMHEGTPSMYSVSTYACDVA